MAFLPLAPVGTRTWTRSTVAAPLPLVGRPCRRPPGTPRWVAQASSPPPSAASPSLTSLPAPATLADLLSAAPGRPGVVPAAGSPLAALLDARTRLGGGTRLVCVYAGGESPHADRGDRDGDVGDPPPTAGAPFWMDTFHAAVDLGGVPTLLVGCDADGGGGVWGGYNPVGWDSRDDYRDSLTAFLFREPPPGGAEAAAGAAAVAAAAAEAAAKGGGSGDGAAAAAATSSAGGTAAASAAAVAAWAGGDGSILVADKVGGGGAAIFDFADWAVRWGSDALAMPMNDAKGLPPDRAVSVLGTQYGVLPGGGRTLFGGGRSSVTVTALRVYVSEQWAPVPAVEGGEKEKGGGGFFGRLFGGR
ncbi:hypothetical protein BU14_0052s0063 [Porphyra umbilicalis]|uniref:TLDc domain-containing protein n=1 Tax=Porphyra umbilicalis TaxID=2786 RepID=A0A1X6PIC6_PORUM|nr:hypothetical protein BU14_0052s0063 [Porphyra umbilicalis]|eukprot:OSX80448.1 hypothetical protein BU14_0052s0063 [Porphyra umbilicalis]